ncbi:hypothetical protein [Paracraurococcus lichenis]|uniref:hypothetical protein n=1 Tax=Paracraurococcus lichenis TaxID=3064888 RepID=UPI00351CDDBA
MKAKPVSTAGSPWLTSVSAPASETAMPSPCCGRTLSPNSRNEARTISTGITVCSMTMLSAVVVCAAV